jgi:hypothetical protein
LTRRSSGIRHIPCGVHNRLENVSAALRKRNYRLRASAEYRLANGGSRSNEFTRLATNSFRVKHARKPLFEQRFGGQRSGARRSAAAKTLANEQSWLDILAIPRRLAGTCGNVEPCHRRSLP